MNDYRGGAQSSGVLNITGAPPLVGLFAWTPMPELFNTAALSGVDVTAPILAQGVPAFGARGAPGSGVLCVPGGGNAMLPFVLSGCNVVLHASSVGAAKGAVVRVVYSAQLLAQVGLEHSTGARGRPFSPMPVRGSACHGAKRTEVAAPR